MAEKLVNDSNLSTFASELKKRFPLISSLATVNGMSLVNGGDDITIAGRRDVLFFNGQTTPENASVTMSSTTSPADIAWHPVSKTFVARVGTAYYNNWGGDTFAYGSGDDWGESTTKGRIPYTDRLYVDYSTRKIYRWDGSALVEMVDTTLFTIVTALPTADASTLGKVYLVPSDSSGTTNAYTEYITIASGTGTIKSYKWEKLGEYTPGVDLSNYPTKTEVANELAKRDTAIGERLRKTDAQTLFMSVANYGYSVMTTSEVVSAVTAVFGS